MGDGSPRTRALMISPVIAESRTPLRKWPVVAVRPKPQALNTLRPRSLTVERPGSYGTGPGLLHRQ
jgi:hypothetical protein